MHIAWNKGWSYGVEGQPKTADLFVAWFDDSIQNPWWRLLTSKRLPFPDKTSIEDVGLMETCSEYPD